MSSKKENISFSHSFLKILESSAFVDKSMLIKQFLESSYHHVFYHGPSSFGKSVNLDMIQHFTGIEVTEEDHHIIPPEKTAKFELFHSEKLEIRHENYMFDKHFASYPTIHFNFSELRAKSYRKFLQQFARMVSEAYSKYEYIYDVYKFETSTKHDSDLAAFETFILQMKCTESVLQNSGQILAQILHEYFGRQCILYVDDYDSPILSALLDESFPKADVGPLVDFLGGFLRNMIEISPAHVIRSFMTGITRVGSPCNSLQHFRFLDRPEIAAFYGFTHDEVDKLFQKFSLSHKMSELDENYEGFYANKSKPVFCPYSICKFIVEGEMKDWWVPLSSDIDPLFSYDKMGPVFENSSKGIALTKIEKLEKKDFLLLKDYINNTKSSTGTVRQVGMNLILRYFYDAGIYTITENSDPDLPSDTVTTTNTQINRYLMKKIYTPAYFTLKHGINANVRKAFIDSAAGIANFGKNFENLRKALNDLFLDCRKPDKECTLQTIVISALQTEPVRIVYTNVEDIVKAVPKKATAEKSTVKTKTELITSRLAAAVFLTDTKCGVILDFKCGKESSCAGLVQIIDMQYYKVFEQKSRLRNLRVEAQVFIGVHFCPETKTTTLSYLWNTKDLKKAVTL